MRLTISPVLEDNPSGQSTMGWEATTGVPGWDGSLSTAWEKPGVSTPIYKNQHLPVITTKVMSLESVGPLGPGVQVLTSTLNTTNPTLSDENLQTNL